MNLDDYKKEIIDRIFALYGIDISLSLSLITDLCEKDSNLKTFIEENMRSGKIRFFDEREFEKILSQNFRPVAKDINEFIDVFLTGKNCGSCAFTSRKLSLSFDDADLVSGILLHLKGTRNAEREGGHCWLENNAEIIDTSLMLVINKTLKEKLGYIEEQRLTPYMLMSSQFYMAEKEFANDSELRTKSKNKHI